MPVATRGTTARFAAFLGGAAVAVIVAGGAEAAAPSSKWDAIAQCESDGDWRADTGNGHYGGLQFTPSSWSAAGGDKYAPRADQATKAEQVSVAERLADMQGMDAWACA